MDITDVLKWAPTTAGVTVIAFAMRAFLQTVGKSKERDDLLRTTSDAVSSLGAQFKEHTERVGEKLDDISGRTTRVEFILTGDKGLNGVRGQVKNLEQKVDELAQNLFKTATAEQTRLAEQHIWRTGIENAIDDLSERRSPSPRRRQIRRKPA